MVREDRRNLEKFGFWRIHLVEWGFRRGDGGVGYVKD